MGIGMRNIQFGVVGLFAVALLLGAVSALPQNPATDPVSPPAAQPPARPQFFAGTVVELDASHVKVTRTLVGRPTESRSFAINQATKMNKTAIKLHNRVTVRYKHLDQGDLALEIQPRPFIARTPKS
jgi:hypothetical protein